jgi:site-specific recombinase XerD
MKPEIKKICHENLDLSEEMDNYLLDLEENGKSQKTILNYRGWIMNFLNYILEDPKKAGGKDNGEFIEIPKVKLSAVRFQAYLMEKGQKNSTINLKTIALNSFFKFLGLTEKDRRGRDTTLKVDLKEVNKKHSIEDNRLLESSDFFQLMDVVKDANDLRAYALFNFLYDTGARISEALSVNIEDLEEVGPGEYKIPIRGKRSKERDLEFSQKVYEAIKVYLASTGKSTKDKGPLFITSRERGGQYHRLSPRSADLSVKKYANKLDLPVTKFFSHNFRKLMARTMLDGGASLDKVKSFLGHSNISTTAIYTMDKASTLRGIKADAKRQARAEYLLSKYGTENKKILELIIINPGISNNKLAELMGISKATFSRKYGKTGIIKNLRKELESQ